MTWELRKVEDIECTLDDSGVYAVVNRMVHLPQSPVVVRLDLMRTSSKESAMSWNSTGNDEPIMSFVGTANNVRKAVIGYLRYPCLSNGAPTISLEHASYIGYELHCAETDPNYVQD